MKGPAQLVWQTINEFLSDGCPQMAAAISFYTLFSLPPLLVVVIMLVDPFLARDAALQLIEREVGNLIGPQGAAQLDMLLENVTRPGQGGPLAATLGIAAFAFGATAAFAQLQGALNAAWQVGPDPQRGDVINFLLKRLFSFLMILVIGVMLLASFLLSAALAAFGTALELLAPGLPSGSILRVLETAITFTVTVFLFTGMFRLLPDARVRWGPALFGGLVTATLFTAGKLAISYYLGSTDPGSAYGAAGSLAMVLIWIYYSSMILLIGAEFTQVWMRRRGQPIEPERGAVRVILRRERYEPDEQPTVQEGAKE
ncbi:MAG: YihY/virulence factor BrkB family protein [Gemmatimonadota bacterium]